MSCKITFIYKLWDPHPKPYSRLVSEQFFACFGCTSKTELGQHFCTRGKRQFIYTSRFWAKTISLEKLRELQKKVNLQQNRVKCYFEKVWAKKYCHTLVKATSMWLSTSFLISKVKVATLPSLINPISITLQSAKLQYNSFCAETVRIFGTDFTRSRKKFTQALLSRSYVFPSLHF